ncbi:lysophospholipid acyltransferase family protein [Thiolinea disciformis]|uniref:lysophospholipid acyltransferase family protein n=1 Tax=Thiolinea disciformis TaxID=125614 RepID=UPI00037523FB|nr:lysophospholipid acyltransferase family protein [Thiolinea disciformis]
MGIVTKLWLGVRATLFWLGFASSTLFYGLLSPLLNFIPYPTAYRILVSWCSFNVWWLKITCGVNYRIEGLENIPTQGAAVLMANHQSTWETLAFAPIFPAGTWVLKRELLKVPFFGWGLRVIKPVAIDRSAGQNAVDQVKEQGKARLDAGIWMFVFPEGTRVKFGAKARYKLGGAILATHANVPVLPVAHNAGASWPRHSYIKIPGTITVKVGKPIASTGKSAEALMQEVEQWIEAEKGKLVFQPA